MKGLDHQRSGVEQNPPALALVVRNRHGQRRTLAVVVARIKQAAIVKRKAVHARRNSNPITIEGNEDDGV